MVREAFVPSSFCYTREECLGHSSRTGVHFLDYGGDRQDVDDIVIDTPIIASEVQLPFYGINLVQDVDCGDIGVLGFYIDHHDIGGPVFLDHRYPRADFGSLRQVHLEIPIDIQC